MDKPQTAPLGLPDTDQAQAARIEDVRRDMIARGLGPPRTRTDEYVDKIVALIDGECLSDAAGIVVRKGTREKLRKIVERIRR